MATDVKHKFDAESGQVFVEHEVPFKKQHSDWIGEPKSPSLLKKQNPNGHGARSLADMAKIKVALSFSTLSSEHFAAIPWALAERVWEELVSMRAESFHAWRTLAAAYPDALEFGQRRYRYLLEIKQPSLPLSNYFHGLTSPDLKWHTCLRISPKQMAISDLVALAHVRNLAVLDLSDGQITVDHRFSSFDERVMRTWADLARSGAGFQHVRVLMFGWQENLSSWLFHYVEDFPSLCHVILTDCPLMHQRNRSDWETLARDHGWEARHSKKSAKSLRPIIGENQFRFGAVSGAYYDTHELCTDLAHKKRSGLVGNLPVLECWIGSPRSWTHIVDDFPGTRTIFFEKTKAFSKLGCQQQLDATPKTHEQAKRSRKDSEQVLPDTSSPPPKRPQPKSRPGPKTRPTSVVDLLAEFHS